MKSLTWVGMGILALPFALAGMRDIGTAHADVITFDVSADVSAIAPQATCLEVSLGAGCTLGGDIVINNTTGEVISAGVTVAGESPVVGPFTAIRTVILVNGILTLLQLNDASGNFLGLPVLTPLFAGSFLGYTGGPLATTVEGPHGPQPFFGSISTPNASWDITSGSLTQALVSSTGGPGSVTPLPTTSIGSISGTIGGDGATDAYAFSWSGGAFGATASITGANANAGYEYFLFNPADGTYIGSAVLTAADSFTATISEALPAGIYDIGIITRDDLDLEFTIDFATPVEGVPASAPEPASSALLASALIIMGLGVRMRHLSLT